MRSCALARPAAGAHGSSSGRSCRPCTRGLRRLCRSRGRTASASGVAAVDHGVTTRPHVAPLRGKGVENGRDP
eukprot:scaffold9051_cov57-Phaeocystis_antarctica.AAC.2